MGKSPSYFIVESSALPEIFLKVAEAKRLLETGEVDTVHLATGGWASAAAHFINTGCGAALQ